MTSKTIVLINSEANVREVMHAYLSYPKGWQVLNASSPLEGLECAAQARPDAVIFDLSTFGMNFLAFLKRLRLQPSNQNTPVVLVADKKWLDSELLQEFQIAGVIDFYTDAASIPQQVAKLLNWDEVPLVK
ncbi:MAG: hypothetical protein VKL42_12055 [Snowella sp.]|nr:hypothetical protein [Snowella sp.]